MTSTALEWPWPRSTVSLFLSLYIISLGQGGYNPSLQAFGADQLEIDDDQDDYTKKKSLFFQWWYFGICSGSLLGISLMAYIQDTLGWGLGFAIPTISMVTSIAVFSCGTGFYANKKAKSVDIKFFVNIFRTLKASATRMINMCNGGGINLLKNKSDVIELE